MADRICVLGLDPGLATGVALAFVAPGAAAVDPSRLCLDLWDLSSGPYDSGASRLVRLRHLLAQAAPAFVAFERPVHSVGHGAKASNSQRAVEFLGALVGTIGQWCEERGIPGVAVPVAAVKKHATGRGNAGKPDMVRAAIAAFGATLDPESDRDANLADAAFVLSYALQHHGAGLAAPAAGSSP